MHFIFTAMNKLRQKKQQILRFLFGSFSATALMFTFQACYGMPSQYEFPMEGTVVSESTEEPVPEIRVIAERNGIVNAEKMVNTDDEGHFMLQLNIFKGGDSVNIHLRDVDSVDNGQYSNLDTVLSVEEATGHPHVFKMKEKSAE